MYKSYCKLLKTIAKGGKMKITKWTSDGKINRFKFRKVMKGMRIMAVSIATIPIIKGEAAKQMLESTKMPTITKKFIEECKEETKGITIRRIR